MLGFSVAWRPASDAFFLRSFTPWHAVKREAVATVHGRLLAVGSVNDHGRHFTPCRQLSGAGARSHGMRWVRG